AGPHGQRCPRLLGDRRHRATARAAGAVAFCRRRRHRTTVRSADQFPPPGPVEAAMTMPFFQRPAARLHTRCRLSRRAHILTRTLRHGALCLAMALVLPRAGLAQAPLTELSLEELMQLDAGQVFGASERLQPVTEAPASVSFITADEIARFGYRTLADILRSVRGMYVSDDRNFSFLGIRGFGKPGDYNSRIL